jgi:CRP/FNR family transcriptional regulator
LFSFPVDRPIVPSNPFPNPVQVSSFTGASPWRAAAGGPVRLLSHHQRQQLSKNCPPITWPKQTLVYRERTRRDAVYVIEEGVLKAFRQLPGGKCPIVAFLYPEDVFGLAADERYVNSTQTITPVKAVRIPIGRFREVLARDSELELRILCKITHELRLAQRHAITIGRHDSVGRLAMFLQHLSDRFGQTHRGPLELPMTRRDIAAYLNLSPETLSRACRRLERHGIVDFVGRHSVRVLDRTQLARLAAAM